MSKNTCIEVSASYHALKDDVRALKPDLVPYLENAFQRILRIVETRGPGIVLLELPDLGKVFDKALSSGVFDYSKVPQLLKSRKHGFIFEDVFEDFLYEPHTRVVYQEVDPTFVFLMRTLLYMHKDSVKDTPDENVALAVRSFFQIDYGLKKPSLTWDGDQLRDPDSRGAPSFLDGYSGEDRYFEGIEPDIQCREEVLSLLDRVCRVSSAMFGTLSPDKLCGRHGPGAVADIRTGEDKYTFPSWPKKLGQLFPREQHAYANEWIAVQEPTTYSENEPPAKLLAVPKSVRTPRLITSEPTAHQFLQQGLLRWLRLNMPKHLRVAIDFKSQEPSRELALRASRDGDMMTVDLSSASDRLSLWTVERALAGNLSLLTALHATRTRWVRDSTFTGGTIDSCILRKYAGQGNATTFPVQSIIYTMICITAVLWEQYGRKARVNRRTLLKAAERVRVYGDDLILPSSCGHVLVEILEFLQLKVNWAKTHHKGYFRESCGMDAYKGCDVTPLYMQAFALPEKVTCEALVSWIDVCNNAYRKGLWSLSTWMMTCIPEEILRDIPVSPKPLGCLCFTTHTRLGYFRKTRFSQTLHRTEVYGYVHKTKEVRGKRDTYGSLLQYFVEAPHQDTIWSSGWTVRIRSVLTKRWVPTE